MTSGNKKFAQKAVAVVVMVALLDVVGVAPSVMLFVTGVVVLVWFVSRRSQNREMQRILEFYVAADAILRDEERCWFGFELGEAIEQGENALEVIPDSPPLHLFALGALHHRIGNHDASVEYLSRIVEDDSWDEQHRVAPSPQLRRYVAMLREIENEPSLAPQILGAVRNLERARRKHASQLLAESRRFLQANLPGETQRSSNQSRGNDAEASAPTRSQASMAPPPPISEVLQDIYHDKTTGQAN